MPAPKGNRFWEARSSHGRDKIFSSPEALWEACCEYFEWVENNPLWEDKPFNYQGAVIENTVVKMRAMTIGALCLFIDIDRSTWTAWKKDKDFSAIVSKVEEIIYTQKFAGAAADLLNPNIIARELGLKDESRHELTGKDGGAIEVSDMSEREIARRIAFALAKGVRDIEQNGD